MFIRSHNHLLFTKLGLLKNLKKTLDNDDDDDDDDDNQ